MTIKFIGVSGMPCARSFSLVNDAPQLALQAALFLLVVISFKTCCGIHEGVYRGVWIRFRSATSYPTGISPYNTIAVHPNPDMSPLVPQGFSLLFNAAMNMPCFFCRPNNDRHSSGRGGDDQHSAHGNQHVAGFALAVQLACSV